MSLDQIDEFSANFLHSEEIKFHLSKIREIIESQKLEARDSDHSLPLPETAPVLWSEGKFKKESPPEFIKRVYEPWLGNGLTRSHIKSLDRKLYQAFATWATRHPGESFGFDLPTRSEITDKWVQRVSSSSELGDSLRQVRRYESAVRRRSDDRNL